MIVYIIFSLLWAMYATRFNMRKYNEHARPIACFFLNLLFAPIAIVLATWSYDFEF